MENYVVAAEWYLLGMGLYFIYNLFIRETPRGYIEYIHKETPVPFSDGVLLFIVVMVDLLASFVWPFCTIFDLKRTLKGEPDND